MALAQAQAVMVVVAAFVFTKMRSRGRWGQGGHQGSLDQQAIPLLQQLDHPVPKEVALLKTSKIIHSTRIGCCLLPARPICGNFCKCTNNQKHLSGELM